MAQDTQNMNLTTDLNHILSHAKRYGGWVVVLCPSTDVAMSAAKILSALVGEAPFSGRTAKLATGKVSVAAATDKVFVPDDQPFYIAYLGWDGTVTPKEAAMWENKSTGSIQIGEA